MVRIYTVIVSIKTFRMFFKNVSYKDNTVYKRIIFSDRHVKLKLKGTISSAAK